MNTVVLVSGAMGRLGTLVTDLLLQRGRTVIALDVDNATTRAAIKALEQNPQARGSLIPALVDLLDAAAVSRVVAQHRPASIVHLAAIVSPVCYANPLLARRVNVEGTRNLVTAATRLREPCVFINASSSAVYGSRNPYRDHGRITPATPVNPIECYGEDKIAAENIVAASGLPHATLRLGGIISPTATASTGPDYLLLMRATPRDNRVHAVDARDAALAFVNATERASAINGKTLLIAGNDSCALLQHQIQDDVMQAMGLGRLGLAAGLPGDPDDDRGWGLTDWFDTSEAQRLLDFQQHDWRDTLAWIAQAQGRRRLLLRCIGPLLLPLLRAHLTAQRRREQRGRYADPWTLVAAKYGTRVLAPTRF